MIFASIAAASGSQSAFRHAQSGRRFEISNYLMVAGSLLGPSVLEEVGVDDAYRSAGFTYFSVESRLKYLREILAGENIKILTQILGTIEKKLDLLHQLQTEDGTIAATCEATFIHVDLNTRASCLPSADVATRLAAYAARHDTLKQTRR